MKEKDYFSASEIRKLKSEHEDFKCKPPRSCFVCPYPDCITSKYLVETKEEVDFRKCALGRQRREKEPTCGFGDTLLKARKQQKLTIKQLSQMTSISYNSVRKYEKNEMKPRRKNFLKICEALKFDPEKFF